MKMSELAKRVGKSAPYLMTLQKKFGLPACKDYPEGYAISCQGFCLLNGGFPNILKALISVGVYRGEHVRN